ncbi:MAG TPA: ABC transporter permease [Thermoanaerobaculia bacterium]|nr:ABC transporter permease [Thermoanaerobaculia bacterium]
MTALLVDLRQALRSLRKTPTATLVIVVTLALGIGANVAIFSVLRGVILRPLPYPEPRELVMVTSQFPGLGFDRFWISPPEYHEYRAWNETLEEVGAYRAGEASVAGGDQPMRVRAAVATATLFRVLGVEPIRGRVFTEEEDVPNGPPVAVLSHELWQSGFGGDESVVGRQVEVNGAPTTIVGIMPPGFDVEDNEVRLWRPVQLDPAATNRGSHFLYLVGRLRDGVPLEQARADLARMLATWEDRLGGESFHVPNEENHRLQLAPLHEEVVGGTRQAVLALLGAVGFVLLIACANVANVMLARSEARQREVAIRNSMGASRFRLVRMLLVESLILAFGGGALGIAVAHFGLQALLRASPDSLPRIDEISIDPLVLLFTVAVAIFTGLLFGIAPALQLRLRRVGSLLKEGGQRTSASGGAARLRRLLVVTELALAVGLVVGAGLMVRSLDRLLSVDAGFDPRGLTSFQLSLPVSRYPDAGTQTAFFDRLLASLESVPGIAGAAAINGLPPLRDVNANDMDFEGVEPSADTPFNIDYWQFVTDRAVETLGIRLLEGRSFGPGDDGQSTAVALVNRRAAETWWKGSSPLGRRMRPCCGDDVPWFTIVGVVDDVKQGGLDQQAGTEVFWSFRQVGERLGFAPRTMYVAVRSQLAPDALTEALRREVWAIDPALPVAHVSSMEEVFGASIARARFLTLLLAIFGGLALTLAALGIYGVMSYTVAKRSQELGIRIALGADRGRVLRLVLMQGLAMTLVGLLVGVVAAWGLSRLLGTLLYGVAATDPATYAFVLALLFTTALLACLLPALRATRVDPIGVLRSE